MYIKNQYDRYEIDQEFFKLLVSEIANQLNWFVETERTSSCFDLSNGLYSICIRCDSNPSKGQVTNPKIDISCHFSEGDTPGSSFHHIIPNAELLARTTSISCSVNRGGKSIANDIKKRLFPDYFFLWNMGIKLKQEAIAREERLRNLTLDLAKIIGNHPHPSSNIGDTIYANPLIIKDDVGVDISVKNSIKLNAVVRQAWDASDVDDVRFDMTLPYDLATQFFEWLSSKTVNSFDTWKENNISFIIRRLDQEASKDGLPPVTQLPPNDFDWVQAFIPSSMDDTHNNRFRLLEQFKKHILPVLQPQPEIIPETKTVEVETQPQPEIIPEQTLTVEFLKTKYKTFKKAKEALQIKARSWQSLAEKLYEKS